MTVKEFYAIEQDRIDAMPNLTIKEYFKLWENFDYYTFMSDDNSVYRRGDMDKIELRKQAKDNWILQEICIMFCQHDGSLGAKPIPKLEDYIETLNEDRNKPLGAEYIDGVMLKGKG